jgi:hypothetical protein
MKKNPTVKVKLSRLDLEILGEALVESERVVYILGDEEYIARYNHITEVIADQMVKLYKKREKAKKRRFRYQKVRFGLWG